MTEPRNNFDWTDDIVARVYRLWIEGLSAQTIAREVGALSRSAVLGKMSRMRELTDETGKLLYPAFATRKPMPPKKSARIKRPKTIKPLRIATPIRASRRAEPMFEPKTMPIPLNHPVWAPIPGVEPVSLMDLARDACKWPLEVPGIRQHMFCGAKHDPGSVYCATHRRMSMTASKRLEEA